MTDFIMRMTEGPFYIVFPFLLVTIFCRAQGTYWLARLATDGILKITEKDGGWRRYLHNLLSGASIQKGLTTIDKWGLIVIPLSFVTIGFQTIVQAACGVLRLRWILYTAVAFPGYIAWALLYTFFGMAAWKAIVNAAHGNPTWAIAITAVIVLFGIYLGWNRFRVGNNAAKAANKQS